MIPLVALVGKKGSVFKASLRLVRQLGLPIELIAAVTYRDALECDPFLPENKIMLLPYRSRRSFFLQLEQNMAVWPKQTLFFSWFDKLVPGWFLEKYPLVNQHPSLLPSFPGMNAWEQALAAGVLITGSTIHIIDKGVDTGPILLQQGLALSPKEDPAGQRHRLFLLQVFQAVGFFYLLTQINRRDQPASSIEAIPTNPFANHHIDCSLDGILAYFQQQPNFDTSPLLPIITTLAG